jgi:hypothetical protein
MTRIREINSGFIEALEKIGEKVDKWPAWKREGWAILDRGTYEMAGERSTNLNSNGHAKYEEAADGEHCQEFKF